jgi:hypothetical protein
MFTAFVLISAAAFMGLKREAELVISQGTKNTNPMIHSTRVSLETDVPDAMSCKCVIRCDRVKCFT